MNNYSITGTASNIINALRYRLIQILGDDNEKRIEMGTGGSLQIGGGISRGGRMTGVEDSGVVSNRGRKQTVVQAKGKVNQSYGGDIEIKFDTIKIPYMGIGRLEVP